MSTFLTIIHVLSCVILVLAVLIQSGKGAELSASFSGSSQSVLGSSGGANFFTKFTAITAGVFMVSAILITVVTGQERKSKMSGLEAPAASAPATAPTNSAAPPPSPGPSEAAPTEKK